jgi:four helix bundle protein
MSGGVRRFEDLRCWRACDQYKKAVYAVCETGSLVSDFRLRDQLRDAVAGPPSHIAEGFGRFNPLDAARFVAYARAALLESQNHLIDAVDRHHITDVTRRELNALAEIALEEVTGWLDYLHSPDALRNARHARERRVVSRPERIASAKPRTRT